MNKNFKFMTGVLSILLCFTAIAFGQGTSGSIEGVVTDQNGAVVAGATVSIKSTGTTVGLNSSTTTDGNGYYQFSRLQVGTYELTATGTGFGSVKKAVVVALDKAAQADFSLNVAGAGATVDVVADANVTLDPGGTKIDSSIDQRVIQDLPSGVTFASLLKVAPNVRPEGLAGGFQIDGASGSENVFVVDGQEVTNFRTGSLDTNFNIPFELVQEVQVKSTGYEAEYGGATGGVINVVTPGGNDSFRGSAGLSFRPGDIQGDRRTVLSAFTAGGQNNTPGNTTYFQPPTDGGTDLFPAARVSGPIVKGRLWFNAVYAPQIFNTTRQIDYFTNTIAGNSTANPNGRTVVDTISYSQRQRQEDAFFRLDGQLHDRLRVFGTFLWNPLIVNGLLPGTTEGLSGAPQSVNFGGTIGTLTGPDLLTTQGGRQNANAFNTQATWNPWNKVIFNGRFGRSFLNERSTAYNVPRTTRYICSAVGGPVNSTTAGCLQGFQNIASNAQNNFDVSTRKTLDIDASFVGINALGRHNFKGGFQLNRLFNTVDRGYVPFGIIQLFYNTAISALAPVAPTGPLCPALPNPPTPGCVLGSGLMTRFGTIGEASSDNKALFVQDSWTINNRATLNLGLRIENEVVPNFGATGSNAIKFGWGDKISPRFGFAFDLTGDGKTKVFANYGWFYDRFKYELPRGSFGGDFFRRDFFEITAARGTLFNSYTRSNILGTFTDPIGGECPIATPTGYSVCQFDFRIATNLEGADIFETGAIDPNIKAARQSEYTFGVERQLSNNFLMSARYTHKQIDRAIEDVGVFNAQGSEAYIIGNPGFGLVCEIAADADLPCAKAQRDYDAVEVRVDKRSTNYFFNGSYTWSRLFGNYSGLASSDEAGRTSPNVNRFFDLPPLGFTADGDPDNGRLATDRPHVFKAYGGYSYNWNSNNRMTVSAFTTFQSGTPLTTIYNLYSLGTTILNGRGDLGRTEMFTETDFSINHRYRFGNDGRFTLEGYLDIRNLFDEANVLGVQTNINGTNFTGSMSLVGGVASATNPNAGNPVSPLVLGGCPRTTTVGGCGSEAAVFQTIFNGPGIRTYLLNYMNNNNIGTLVTPFGAPAGSLVQTPIVSRVLNTYGQPNNFQGPRDIRFGFRLNF